MQAILDMAETKLKKLDQRRREELPLSELLIGMQSWGYLGSSSFLIRSTATRTTPAAHCTVACH